MASTDPIWVLGHRNPDTDAIASAIGYAWLLGRIHPERYVAGRAGNLNVQTTFAVQKFGAEVPTLISDIRSRVGDVMETMPYLHADQTVLEACQSIARTERPAALLDAEKRPLGLITGAGLFGNLVEALSSASVLALAKEFAQPAATAIDDANTTLEADDYVQDVLGEVLRTAQDDFVVVDRNGKYAGVTRKSALLSPPHRRVVLVDHNEVSQAVPGMEEAEIIEILDHHRLSGPSTQIPIRILIEPVGSCSTLVYERAREVKETFPGPIAGMLLSGILSDTLIFRSPTSTERDRSAAIQLARWAELAADSASDEEMSAAIESYGRELLGSGAGLGTRPATEIITTDVKFFEVEGLKVGISQVEVTTFSELVARREDLKAALEAQVKSEGLEAAILMVTDVVRGNSRLLTAGSSRILLALPYQHLDDETLDAPGVVSRKKQLLPSVLAAMSQMA